MKVSASKSIVDIAQTIARRDGRGWVGPTAEFFSDVTAQYRREGNFVIVKLTKPDPGGNIISIGVSKRHPDDGQNLNCGVNLALNRAIASMFCDWIDGGGNGWESISFPAEGR